MLKLTGPLTLDHRQLSFPPTAAMGSHLVSPLNISGTHCPAQDHRDHSSSCQSCPMPCPYFPQVTTLRNKPTHMPPLLNPSMPPQCSWDKIQF